MSAFDRGPGGGGYGGYGGRPQIQFGGPMTTVVKIFMIICGAGFVLSILFPGIIPYLGLTPAMFWHGAFFQLVTYNFLHGGVFHLLMNLFVFWMFAGNLEALWGKRKFIVYLVVTGLGAGLTQVIVAPTMEIPVIGASGIVYGILMAYGLTYPNRTVYLYFLLPIKVKWFVLGIGVLELLSSINGQSELTGVAHVAHLGGMVFGFFFLRYDNLYFKVRNIYYRRKLEKHKKKNPHIYVVRGDNDDRPFYH